MRLDYNFPRPAPNGFGPLARLAPQAKRQAQTQKSCRCPMHTNYQSMSSSPVQLHPELYGTSRQCAWYDSKRRSTEVCAGSKELCAVEEIVEFGAELET